MRWIRFLCCFLLAALFSMGVLAQTREFNIPAGDLKTALDVYARQSGVQIVYRLDEISAIQTKGVTGSLSAPQALARILEGTGFTSHRDASGAIAIVRVTQSPRSGSADRDVTRLDSITVTAQKRDERAFDVPISIVAMGAEELQARKVSSLDDLSLAVPGLQISSSGSHTRQIFIRGVSNTQGVSSLIGMYLDEASVTLGSDTQLDLRAYDLARVEVLRGPQGTLYGEGSAGGTIRFITVDPELDRHSFRADASSFFTESGAPGQRIEGVVNVPLIDNELALRIVGTFDHQGGWMDQPALDRRNVNDQNLVNVRIKGLWQPSARFSAGATAVVHRNDAPRNVGEDAGGNYTQTLNFATTPSTRDAYEFVNLTASYEFPGARLLSSTSYINQVKETRNLGGRFQLLPPPAPRFEVHQPLQSLGNDVVNEELRLTSTGAGPLRWTMGAFYRDGKSQLTIPEIYFGLPRPPGDPAPTPFGLAHGTRSKSWAVFGDAAYTLAGGLTLGAGLRYFKDDQEDNNGGVIQSAGFHSVNPRVYAQYRVSDAVNTYATAAKGFRSGGFNGFGEPTFGPEEVWTYEIGTKVSLLQGRLVADFALYHSDYDDYQISGVLPAPAPPFGILSNAGKARIRGVEWAIGWRPADQWTLGFGGNYVDTKFVELNADSTAYIVGDRLDYFSRYSYTLSAERAFNWHGKPGFARLDYNKHGPATYRNRSIGPWYFSQSDVIDMLNFNLLLWWNENLSVSAFAQNLLDDRGYTGPNSIDEFAARARPRTFGIGFGVTF